MKIGILWAQFGPYHFARLAALQRAARIIPVYAFELSNSTRDYQWSRATSRADLMTLFPGAVAEHLGFSKVYFRIRSEFKRLGITVCLLPSYSPKESLAALMAAKSLGIRTVMMNESHAGTARATGPSAFIKRRLVRMFDAAIVGGKPHRRYFTFLGLPDEKIFPGYDAIDNDHFARRADEIRKQPEQARTRYDLPSRYFLSLGRFVPKKNLTTLIRAYQKFLTNGTRPGIHLVMVGSGQEEKKLRSLCAQMNLPVYEKSGVPNQTSKSFAEKPGVHFYGFRQIEENPVFYALADAFILPSLHEEWGLVVNEAMACGLPVIASETAGCAEDLIEAGLPETADWAETELQVQRAKLQHKIRRNGFVFDPRSVDELRYALEITAASPGLRMAMGEHSWSIVHKFSCENFATNALLAVKAATGSQLSPGGLAAGRTFAQLSQ